MKGKNTFTKTEIKQLEQLIELRNNTAPSGQKGIRQKMRNLGFYGRDDFGINDLQLADLQLLIFTGRIKVTDGIKSVSMIYPKSIVKPKTVQNTITIPKNSFDGFSFNNIDELKNNGFIGFKKISELFFDTSSIPTIKGIYIVLNQNKKLCDFLAEGTGGYFKSKNPNISIDLLKSYWVDKTIVVYIGKAGSDSSKATLKSRLSQYLGFGQGKSIGHYGGRLIWQLKNANDLVICWKPLAIEDPRKLENNLIQMFVSKYGKRPFANLVN